MTVKHTLFILLVTTFLSGCSALKTGYNFADDLLLSRAADYLDFDQAGETEARAHIEEMVLWHRKEMLPQYAIYLEAQADRVEKGRVTESQVQEALEDFRKLLANTMKGASPYMARILHDHVPDDKRNHFEAQMASALQERLEDEQSESREESLQEWQERRTKNIRRFIGDLNEEQRAVLRDFAPQFAFSGLRWLESRKMRQDAVIAFMRKGPSEAELSAFVSQLLTKSHEIVDPDYYKISEARWQRRIPLYYKILETLDQEQRDRLVASLRDYAQDMRDLAKDS